MYCSMDDLRFILQVSQVTVVDSIEEIQQNSGEYKMCISSKASLLFLYVVG